MASPTSRALSLLAFAAVCLATSVASAEVAARGRLLGTGAGEHVWWIDVRPEGAFLLHASARVAGPIRAEIAQYEQTPDAMAANSDRLWLAFPATADRPDLRDVVTMAMRQSVATGLYYAEPRGGADLVASLPVEGELIGFAADAHGPYALFQPAPPARFGVHREGASQGAPEGPAHLLRLVGSEWKPVDLPLTHRTARSLALASSGDSILLVAPDEMGGTTIATRTADGWSIDRIALPATNATWMNVAGRNAVGFVDGSEIRFAYLRDASLLPWARAGLPGAAWFAAGDQEGAVIVSGGAGVYSRRRLGPIDASAGPLEPLQKPGFSSGAWIHVPVLAAIVLAGVMSVIFLRALPTAPGAEVVPEPPALGLERRAMALAIDLIPGALIAMWTFSARPAELLALPSWSLELAATEPAVLAIGITCLHGAVSEFFVGRSLGKTVVGGVVVSGDGSPATWRQILVRAIFKFVTLCAPILASFVFFTQANRSIGDVLARTIVADARDRSNDAQD